MERTPPRPMTPFDCLTSPAYLHSMKLMLPYTPRDTQRMLGVYIKFLEFQHTLWHFHGFPEKKDGGNFLAQIKDYMEPSERQKMEQMENLMNMMEMVQNLQGAGDIKDMFPPGQQEMFELYSNIFNDALNTPDSAHEKEREDSCNE